MSSVIEPANFNDIVRFSKFRHIITRLSDAFNAELRATIVEGHTLPPIAARASAFSIGAITGRSGVFAGMLSVPRHGRLSSSRIDSRSNKDVRPTSERKRLFGPRRRQGSCHARSAMGERPGKTVALTRSCADRCHLPVPGSSTLGGACWYAHRIDKTWIQGGNRWSHVYVS